MILITGGLGYIGSHVNKLLSSQGYSGWLLIYEVLTLHFDDTICINDYYTK